MPLPTSTGCTSLVRDLDSGIAIVAAPAKLLQARRGTSISPEASESLSDSADSRSLAFGLAQRLSCLQSARDLREHRAHHLRGQLAGVRILSAWVIAANQRLSVWQLVDRPVCEPWPWPQLDAA